MFVLFVCVVVQTSCPWLSSQQLPHSCSSLFKIDYVGFYFPVILFISTEYPSFIFHS